MQQQTTHDASCRCSDCRARRVSQHARQQAGQPTQTFTPLPLAPVHGEQDAIAQDPVGYIMAQKEQGGSIQEIRNRLILAGIDADTADGLIQSAEAPYESDRRERGVRRIKKGAAFVVSGLALTIPLVLFGGIFTLLGGILVLVGLFQLGKGPLRGQGVGGLEQP